MDLGEKLRRLRANEGLRRGQWRPLTQREVVTALQAEQGVAFSQAYLSQVEQGRRGLSDGARAALAHFYGVHPGYLVSDPADPAVPVESAPLSESSALHDVRSSSSSRPNLQDYAINHAPNGVFSPPGHFGRVPQRQPPVSGVTSETAWGMPGDVAWPEAHLLVALRDHPDPRRVLLMMERLLNLSQPQLLALERAVNQIQQTESLQSAATGTSASQRPIRRNSAQQGDVFSVGTVARRHTDASERRKRSGKISKHNSATGAQQRATTRQGEQGEE